MREEKSDKIWVDWYIKKYIYIGICASGFLFFLTISFKQLAILKLSLDYFSILSILTFFLLLTLHILRVRLSFILPDSIRIGNAPDDTYEIFRLKQKPTTISWNDIKKIKIFGRQIRHPLNSVNIDILSIKTKDNKKYESFIAQPKGFIQAIKKLKKTHLLSKNSKYLDLEKK